MIDVRLRILSRFKESVACLTIVHCRVNVLKWEVHISSNGGPVSRMIHQNIADLINKYISERYLIIESSLE